MSSEDIVRAWKDPDRRGDADFVDHPAGEITLDVIGGGQVGIASTEYLFTLFCCNGFTSDTCTCVATLCAGTIQCTMSPCVC